MQQKSPHPPGALFEESDYAGMWRRLLAIAIDFFVLWGVWFAIAWTWYRVIRPGEEPLGQATLCWLAFVYGYLVVFKASPVRTLGYRVAGVRIVDYRGQRPGIPRMTFRCGLWLLGPLNPLIDWLWLGSDRHKQTLRDKFAGTYVVRASAEPACMSPRRTAYYSLFALTLMFIEIQPAGDGPKTDVG